MSFGKRLTKVSVAHPGVIIGIMVFVTLFLALGVALPTLWPGSVPLPPVRVDTDPENMLESGRARSRISQRHETRLRAP